MPGMLGSQSQYAAVKTGSDTAQRFKAASASPTSSSVIQTTPVSTSLANLTPGSQEWINAKMSTVIQQLTEQYKNAAASRGTLQSGAWQKELSDAIAAKQAEVEAEASNYNASARENELNRQSSERQSDKAAKSAERAAMYSGLGQMAPTLLFGKWGKGDSTLAGSGWDALKSNIGSRTTAPVSATPSLVGSPTMTPQTTSDAVSKIGDISYTPSATTAPATGSKWDQLTTGQKVGSVGLGAAGTGLGMMLNKGNALGSALAGGAATYGSSTGGQGGTLNALLPLIASSMVQTKGKALKGDNLWKNLVAALAVGGSFL